MIQLIHETPGFQAMSLVYESHHTLVYRALRTQNQRPVILKVRKQQSASTHELSRYHHEYHILRHVHASATSRLVANTLGCDIEQARPLSDWIYQKTEGPVCTNELPA